MSFSNSRCSSVGILMFIDAASPFTEPIKPIDKSGGCVEYG